MTKLRFQTQDLSDMHYQHITDNMANSTLLYEKRHVQTGSPSRQAHGTISPCTEAQMHLLGQPLGSATAS